MASLYLLFALAMIVVFSVSWALVGFIACSSRKCWYMLPVCACIVKRRDRVVCVRPMYCSALLCGRGHENL